MVLTDTFSNKTDSTSIQLAHLERVRFEELIAEIACDFVATSESELEATTSAALRKIGEFMVVDRVLLFQFNPDESLLFCQHEWTAGDLAPAMAKLQKLSRATRPWLFPKLGLGEPVVINRVSELPDDASMERSFLQWLGVESAVCAPLKVGGRVMGALFLHRVSSHGNWSEQLLARLKLVGNIIVSARERIHSRVARRTTQILADNVSRLSQTPPGEAKRQWDELAHADRIITLGEMAAGIAHELSQPLYSIKNFINAARNVVDQNPQSEWKDVASWLKQASNATGNAGAIIERLRYFARSNRHRRHEQPITGLIQEAITFMEFEMRRRETRVVLENQHVDATVLVDRVEILQVLVNLLQNACEAMATKDPAARIVTITVSCDEEVRVRVRDRGIGLPDDERDIFDPFMTTKPQGLGLGLAISKSIIEKHGGRLSAERNADAGATFQVAIPKFGESDKHE